MPATGKAADAGYTLDAFLKVNASIGSVRRTANSAVQSIKVNGVTKTATAGVVDLGATTDSTTTTLTAGMIAGAI